VKILSRTVGLFEENSYLVVDETTREAVLIDPGDAPDQLLDMLRESGAELRAIWITHGHLDHIGAVEAIRRVYPVPVYLHAADRPVYDAQSVFAEAYGVPFEQPAAADAEIAHGDVMRVGTLSFDVHHAPGHSPGHVVFLGHGVMLGGDVLFAGSIGRTDLPLANPAHMSETLKLVSAFPPETIVYPGHGEPTTIGAELRGNPFLNGTVNVKRDTH
jgi:glyoxylase-like metal-dependent hydrolase (beta-lactamase superfamily II)